LVILLVARETGNQFEWQTHAPLARRAGLEQETIAAIADGRHPRCLHPSAQTAADFASELLRRNGVSDTTFQQAAGAFGQPGVVELTALVGYFTMVCWIMNVARTPGPAASGEPPLSAWPP
jgi:4-carboxymuconolactone decarboxylase